MKPAVKTATAYLVAGFLWILFSDRVLASLVRSPELLSRLQTYKGWLFVLVTGILLYLLVNRYFRRVEESQAALDEKNRTLTTLFGNLPGMAYRCRNDEEWTMEFVSEGCGAVTGYQPADLVQNRTVSYGDLIHEDDRQLVWDRVQVALEEDGTFQLVYRIRNKGGEERWVWERGRGVPVPGTDRRVIEGFISDVSELKELQAQVHQSQKLEAVGRLAGSVAHDFNNILTAIGGYGTLLADRIGSNEAVRRDLAEIQKATQKGGALTRQLLAFSRKQDFKPEILDLNVVVADMENMIGQLLGKTIRVTVTAGGRPGWIRADRGQIEQVLLNLAVNARDAMPTGGSLTIETSRRRLRTQVAEDLALPPGQYQILEVGDTGTGMDESTLSRIFEPYFTTKEKDKGTGLGLAIVYGVIKQSGAHIRVTSRRGRGTTFTMFFPPSEPPTRREEAGVAGGQSVEGSERVVVIESNEELRSLLKRTLEAKGYRVRTAAGAEGGDALLSVEPPADLLILEHVSDPATRRLLHRLRSDPASPRLLVLAPGTQGTEIDPEFPVPVVVLRKPFTPSELLRDVRSLLGREESPGDAERPTGS